MLQYINETEYKNMLGVQSIPDNFNQKVIEASNYINFKTFGRINANNAPEEVKYVTCLLLNLIDEENKKIIEIGSLKSQNIEGWSETYATPEEIKRDYDIKKYELLKQYLWNVIGVDGLPLLYVGV
jgi:hypothetical protein